MTFTPPDFSEILANEQTMNSRLTTLRSNLRTGLTNAGISYSQSDTISQLIDRYEILPIFQTDVNVNPQTAGKLGTLYKMSNISAAAWSAANNGNYNVTYTNDTTKTSSKRTAGIIQQHSANSTQHQEHIIMGTVKDGKSNHSSK